MIMIESLKMIEHPRDEGPAPQTGQGGGGGGPGGWRAPQDVVAPSSWVGLRDPRIVRVPRSLGGKDRHSKVSTIRGLRDRRVRLSVPTALQLYDIQDRLGLSQPSKAVDWLLNNAQHEIDKLPPLQFPPAGSFIQFPPPIAAPHGTDPYYDLQPASGAAIAAQEVELMAESGSGSLTLLPRDHTGVQMGVQHRPTKWSSSEFPPRARWKESTRGAMDENDGLIRRLMVEQDQHHGAEVHSTVVPVHPSLPSMPSNNNSYASHYYALEGSNICVAHVGGGHVIPQEEETHGYRPQHLLLCPSGMPSPMFSPYAAAPQADCDPKHANSFHMGSSTS